MIRSAVPREEDRLLILDLAVRHGIRNVRLFGSAARGEATNSSDLDLLVDMESGGTLFDLIAFWLAVEESLDRKVDVISDGGVSHYLRDGIYAEAVPL